jgi:hypothetical protein
MAIASSDEKDQSFNQYTCWTAMEKASPKAAKSPRVGSFLIIVGLSALIFSDNLGTKRRCYRAERFMFSGYYK